MKEEDINRFERAMKNLKSRSLLPGIGNSYWFKDIGKEGIHPIRLTFEFDYHLELNGEPYSLDDGYEEGVYVVFDKLKDETREKFKSYDNYELMTDEELAPAAAILLLRFRGGSQELFDEITDKNRKELEKHPILNV